METNTNNVTVGDDDRLPSTNSDSQCITDIEPVGSRFAFKVTQFMNVFHSIRRQSGSHRKIFSEKLEQKVVRLQRSDSLTVRSVSIRCRSDLGGVSGVKNGQISCGAVRAEVWRLMFGKERQ